MKFNPFRPNSAVAPGMFVGRVDELFAIEQCMLQTKNMNPQHFIILGERGIGKTSLLDYVQAVSNGEYTTLQSNIKFRFLTIFVDLGGCSDKLEIVQKLARGFRSELQSQDDLKELASGVLSWLANWEVLGIKYNQSSSTSTFDIEEITEDLIIQISEFCNATHSVLDGVMFLIDEADRPSSYAGLGEYIKFITERLNRKKCYNTLFGLAGLPTLLSKLRESHESSPRLFQIMTLQTLSQPERERVIDRAIEVSNEKNTIQTIIEADARKFLAELSEGYPHFVQQFGYSAFEVDTDNIINFDDVTEGAFSDNGALSQLGDKFFNEMYNALISSDDYRKVLDTMAEHQDNWISRATILAESGVSTSSVNNALKALRDKEIIITDSARRGFYKLPTKSFAAWINAVKSARAKNDAQNS